MAAGAPAIAPAFQKAERSIEEVTKECAGQENVPPLRKRVEHGVSTWPGNPTPRSRPEELKAGIQIDIGTHVHSGLSVVRPHSGIVLSLNLRRKKS